MPKSDVKNHLLGVATAMGLRGQYAQGRLSLARTGTHAGRASRHGHSPAECDAARPAGTCEPAPGTELRSAVRISGEGVLPTIGAAAAPCFQAYDNFWELT